MTSRSIMWVGVIGGGSWGSALGVLLGRNGHRVMMWDLDPDVRADIALHSRNHRYLPHVELPSGVSAADDLGEVVGEADLVVVAVPAAGVELAARSLAPDLDPEAVVVSATKGLCPRTGRRMTQVLAESADLDPARIVALSGPNLALEVVAGLPSATVVSGPSRRSMCAALEAFSCPTLRVYSNPDTIGVELGGALKNVVAIGAGMNDGLGFGDNTKATLLTRGLAEITRIGVSLGALPATFRGLSGLGDLMATSVSVKSRNYRVGKGLGEGRPLGDILAELGQVAEGVPTTTAAKQLAARLGVEAPIADAISDVISGVVTAREASVRLMQRAPKDEIDESHVIRPE